MIEATRDAPRATLDRTAIAVVAICAAILFGDGFDSVAMSFAAPGIARYLALPAGALALPIAAAPIGAAVGAIVLGPLGDRFGRRRLLVAGVLLTALPTLLTATANSLPLVALWRFLTGVGIGMSTPAAAALAADFVPPRLRGRLVTIAFCGLSVGSIAAGLMAPMLIVGHGWPSIFVLGGLLSLMVFPIALIGLPAERADARQAHGLGSVAAILTGSLRRPTALIWLIVLGNGITYSLVSYWLPTLVLAAGFDYRVAAGGGALMHFGGLLGCLAQGWAMDRLGPYRTLSGAFIVGIIGLGLLGVADQAGMMLGGSFIVGLAIEGAIISVGTFTAGFYAINVRATGMGWMTGAGRIGGVVGPLLAGLLLTLRWPPREIFLALTLPAAIALAGVATLAWLCHGLWGATDRAKEQTA